MEKIVDNGLHHVGYVVKDLEATLSTLENTLGKLSYQKYSFKPMKAYCSGKLIENYELKIAMITFEHQKTCIEVIEPVSEGYHMDFIKKTGSGGINHICYAIDGGYDRIKEAYVVQNANFVFESETEDDVIGYRRCFYAEDSLGNVVEIKEKPYFRKER